jgi:hypothetical protein
MKGKALHMTWFGHCITNVSNALRALPTAGQLMLISDLRDFLDRQEQEIRRHQHEAKTKASEGRPTEVGCKAS